jgi:hypothetical protein
VLTTPAGPIEVAVEAREGPLRPESCGAEPAPATVYDLRL